MIKKSFVTFLFLILILSLFFVSANHRKDVQDGPKGVSSGEKFYLDEWLNELWGKITGQQIRTASAPILASNQEIAQDYWTEWFNRDAPSGSGDYETLSDLKTENPGKICDVPSQIECQTTTGVDYSTTGEVVTCDVNTGSVCVNSQQPDGKCNYDYKVRFYCGTLKIEAPTTSPTPAPVEPIEESTSSELINRREIFRRHTIPSEVQPAPTDLTTPGISKTPQTEFERGAFEQGVSPEIIGKSEEIKRLNLELVELNDKYSRNQIFFKKRTSNKLDKLAIERKKEMIELAKEDPILFLNNVIPEEKRNLFPDKIKKYIEEKVFLEGNLITLHIDDFNDINNPVSKFEYFIITKENKKINFYPIAPSGFLPEAEIKVSGYKINDNLVGFVKEIQIKKEKPSKTITGKAIQYPYPTIPPMPEEHKMAVILVNFLDSPSSPFTPAEANDLIFNGQFQNFYQEQSYNKIYFTGDVFGWYTLPRNSQSNCMVGIGWGKELDQYIINNNINLSNYDDLLIVANGPGCGGGSSSGGQQDLTINGQTYSISIAFANMDSVFPNYIISHEIGHSLGLSGIHAREYDCDDKILGLECQKIEYGNSFDVMGNAAYSSHFNAMLKEYLGWILPQEIVEITQSGTYTINALEASKGKKFAKIKMLDSTAPMSNLNLEKTLKSPHYPYYLEYRKGIGFDSTLNNPDLVSNQNGLLINKKLHSNSGGFSFLLDMNATSLDWQEDLKSASLSGNNIFSDPRTGITIGPIINFTNLSITFNVDLQQTSCISDYPMVILDSKQIYNFDAGILFEVSLNIINKDYPICGASDLRIDTSLPGGFLDLAGPITSTFYPEENKPISLVLETSPTLCSGTYPITFSVENLNSGLITTKTIYVNITGTTLCPQEVAPAKF